MTNKPSLYINSHMNGEVKSFGPFFTARPDGGDKDWQAYQVQYLLGERIEHRRIIVPGLVSFSTINLEKEFS